MAEFTPLKLRFNQDMVVHLAENIRRVYPAFPQQAFVADIMEDLEPLELKERVACIAEALHTHLPASYPEAVAILIEILGPELDDGESFDDGFPVMPLGHFVQMYGLDHFEQSVQAMEAITKRFSAEFAVRPYLEAYPEIMLEVLARWVDDPNHHVRRLASEGTRPRLPWSSRLKIFLERPEVVTNLLGKLRNDPSLYVRRSVANHMNDLLKEDEAFALAILEDWYLDSTEETKWIVKHALRNLIKQGHPRALTLLGFGPPRVSIEQFSCSDSITLGEQIAFEFTIVSSSSDTQNLVVDYVVDFVKANGRTQPKVFKLKTVELAPGANITIKKTHSIRPISTRKYYAGTHGLTVQINGQTLAKLPFELRIS